MRKFPRLLPSPRALVAALALIASVASVALVPAEPGSAAGSFTFYGSGYGFGLGLSQWGAYGMALRGYNADQILTHFFSHTSVQQATNAPSSLRVGLAQAQHDVHLAALGGRVTLRIGGSRGTIIGRIRKGDTWRVEVASGHYRVLNADGKRVGGRDWGGTRHDLLATYTDSDARVRVPEGGATYNRGFLEFNLYDCADGCDMRLILTVSPQGYLYGVSEVSSSWPAAALRAQAIAARSYAFAKAAGGQHRSPCNCAVYDTSHDQVYAGWNKEYGTAGSRWVNAVDTTLGDVVAYQGRTVEAYYTSSSGGYTENNENVWGGSPIPWLRGVCDPGDYTKANPNRAWSVSMSASHVTSALRPYTGDIGDVDAFGSGRRGVSGRIESITVRGTSGSSSVSGAELRIALGLRDDRVWIDANRNITGKIRAKYDALMCAPGLPTSPAKDVAGGTRQRFAAGAIYRNPQVPATVWLHGRIYDEYGAVGGAGGVLGLPREDPTPITDAAGCGDSGCDVASFDGGRIYHKHGVGTYALWGRVLTAYMDVGGARGTLGFPTSRVEQPGDGSATATFEHGSISCAAGADTCTVQ